jgi:predicted  nucleic acid-binding Zn-ribbon protein
MARKHAKRARAATIKKMSVADAQAKKAEYQEEVTRLRRRITSGEAKGAEVSTINTSISNLQGNIRMLNARIAKGDDQ